METSQRAVSEYVDILIKLEPVFENAGKLALELRRDITIKNKHQTGIYGVDIVTNGDLAVQEAVLVEMSKTKLAECQLIAEEDTPSVSKFRGTNGLVLTIDPIDGTIFYVSGKRFFSVIICLRDSNSQYYTYCYYPVVNWSRRIANNRVDDFGELPDVKIKNDLDLSRTIAYTSGDPKKKAPKMYNSLKNQGYAFRLASEITEESFSGTLFYLNKVVGYYAGNPGAYDGLCMLHYGQVKKFKIYSDIDISRCVNGPNGPYHPGWYIVLRK